MRNPKVARRLRPRISLKTVSGQHNVWSERRRVLFAPGLKRGLFLEIVDGTVGNV